MSLSQTLWSATVLVHITHAALPSAPPLVLSVPRLSYLALLLPRCAAFFGPAIPKNNTDPNNNDNSNSNDNNSNSNGDNNNMLACSSFYHDGVLLRNLAVGLLADLYAPDEAPWRLTVGGGMGWDISDTFLNCAKEADFIRNGNANQIMKLSKADTTALWNAVRDNDHAAYTRINTRLLNAPTPLKHIPVRLFIPSSPKNTPPSNTPETGAFKVVQSLVPATVPSPRGAGVIIPNRLGLALQKALPGLFPSSRDPVLARVILHGAAVPFSAPLEELMREAAYPDGWLYMVVVLL